METEVLTPPAEKQLWTYEMLQKLAETNLPTEIWNGELIVSAAPNPNHQTIILNVASKLKHKLHAKGSEDEKAQSKLLPGFAMSFREVEL